jgi:DNA replication protein DnaC
VETLAAQYQNPAAALAAYLRSARAMADNRLAREIKNLTRPKLLIIDEVGYLTLEAAHASLLFQAICERYEKQQAIVLTSNKPLPTGATYSPETPSWRLPLWIACCTARR